MNPADLRELRERDARLAVRDPLTGFFKLRRKRPIRARQTNEGDRDD